MRYAAILVARQFVKSSGPGGHFCKITKKKTMLDGLENCVYQISLTASRVFNKYITMGRVGIKNRDEKNHWHGLTIRVMIFITGDNYTCIDLVRDPVHLLLTDLHFQYIVFRTFSFLVLLLSLLLYTLDLYNIWGLPLYEVIISIGSISVLLSVLRLESNRRLRLST